MPLGINDSLLATFPPCMGHCACPTAKKQKKKRRHSIQAIFGAGIYCFYGFNHLIIFCLLDKNHSLCLHDMEIWASMMHVEVKCKPRFSDGITIGWRIMIAIRYVHFTDAFRWSYFRTIFWFLIFCRLQVISHPCFYAPNKWLGPKRDIHRSGSTWRFNFRGVLYYEDLTGIWAWIKITSYIICRM